MTATWKETMGKVIEWRRHLHRYPELSFQEKETSAFVFRHLSNMGWNVRTNVGGHGIVADLDGSRSGRRIALRADMDALPIQDLKTVEYASQVPGVMHACGHDGHTASLLGVAELLAADRDAWSGQTHNTSNIQCKPRNGRHKQECRVLGNGIERPRRNDCKARRRSLG